MNIYIVRGDTCQPWDYQVYGTFSNFDDAMTRAAEMVKKLDKDLEDDWTGLLIESFTVDDPEVPSGCGDSCYSACKDAHEVTLQELVERKLI